MAQSGAQSRQITNQDNDQLLVAVAGKTFPLSMRDDHDGYNPLSLLDETRLDDDSDRQTTEFAGNTSTGPRSCQNTIEQHGANLCGCSSSLSPNGDMMEHGQHQSSNTDDGILPVVSLPSFSGQGHPVLDARAGSRSTLQFEQSINVRSMTDDPCKARLSDVENPTHNQISGSLQMDNSSGPSIPHTNDEELVSRDKPITSVTGYLRDSITNHPSAENEPTRRKVEGQSVRSTACDTKSPFMLQQSIPFLGDIDEIVGKEQLAPDVTGATEIASLDLIRADPFQVEWQAHNQSAGLTHNQNSPQPELVTFPRDVGLRPIIVKRATGSSAFVTSTLLGRHAFKDPLEVLLRHVITRRTPTQQALHAEWNESPAMGDVTTNDIRNEDDIAKLITASPSIDRSCCYTIEEKVREPIQLLYHANSEINDSPAIPSNNHDANCSSSEIHSPTYIELTVECASWEHHPGDATSKPAVMVPSEDDLLVDLSFSRETLVEATKSRPPSVSSIATNTAKPPPEHTSSNARSKNDVMKLTPHTVSHHQYLRSKKNAALIVNTRASPKRPGPAGNPGRRPSSVPSIRSTRELTIPRGPRLATTERLGEKILKPSRSPSDVTLAQSTEVLRRELRKFSPTRWRPGVTTPVPPQLHSSTPRRTPQSATRRQAETSGTIKTPCSTFPETGAMISPNMKPQGGPEPQTFTFQSLEPDVLESSVKSS